jgi:hypothetical protein
VIMLMRHGQSQIPSYLSPPSDPANDRKNQAVLPMAKPRSGIKIGLGSTTCFIRSKISPISCRYKAEPARDFARAPWVAPVLEPLLAPFQIARLRFARTKVGQYCGIESQKEAEFHAQHFPPPPGRDLAQLFGVQLFGHFVPF